MNVTLSDYELLYSNSPTNAVALQCIFQKILRFKQSVNKIYLFKIVKIFGYMLDYVTHLYNLL